MSDSEQDYREFEREFDIVNLVFGAALSAYIGIILATPGLEQTKIWLLVWILGNVVLIMLLIRSMIQALYGQAFVGLKPKYSIFLILVSGISIQLTSLQLENNNNVFSVIFRGWILVMLITHAPGLYRKFFK